MAVKEMINLRDEMDKIITQKYKGTHKCLKKEKGLKGKVEKVLKKKEKWADTHSNKVNELKRSVDKFRNKNTRKECMMVNKKRHRVTKTKKYSAKKIINQKQIVGNFRMRAWSKESKLEAYVSTSEDKLENSESRKIQSVIINVFIVYR